MNWYVQGMYTLYIPIHIFSAIKDANHDPSPSGAEDINWSWDRG